MKESEGKIKELSDHLKAETHFNRKVADNLAMQTQEACKFKQTQSEYHQRVMDLQQRVDALAQAVQSKDDKVRINV